MATLPKELSSSPVLEAASSERSANSDLSVIDSSTRIPALDGLRGIAILLVLLCHSVFELYPNSRLLSRLLMVGRLTWSGVDLFFVLSGFLIGGILLDAKASPRYFRTFYVRRAYRILPLYLAVLTLFSLRYLTSHGSAGPLGSFSHSSIPWFSYVTFTQNIWMAWLGSFGAGAMAATWSLAVEEQFYLTVPFVIRKLSRSRLAFALLAIIVAVPVLRTSLHIFFEHGNFACYVLTPCRADSLSCGVLCSVLVRTPRWWKFVFSHRSALCWITGFLFLGLIPLTFRGNEFSTTMVTFGYSWLAFFYTGCLLIAITGNNSTVQRVLYNRSLSQLGVLAYCVYLLHLPLMEASRRFLGLRFAYSATGTQFVGGLIGVLLTLAVAKLSWVFFEKPLLRRGHAYKY
jgi:peptidoglycan/LPS O-acetylase OafA/YrhL